jgi:hypothetical protein
MYGTLIRASFTASNRVGKSDGTALDHSIRLTNYFRIADSLLTQVRPRALTTSNHLDVIFMHSLHIYKTTSYLLLRGACFGKVIW